MIPAKLRPFLNLWLGHCKVKILNIDHMVHFFPSIPSCFEDQGANASGLLKPDLSYWLGTHWLSAAQCSIATRCPGAGKWSPHSHPVCWLGSPFWVRFHPIFFPQIVSEGSPLQLYHVVFGEIVAVNRNDGLLSLGSALRCATATGVERGGWQPGAQIVFFHVFPPLLWYDRYDISRNIIMASNLFQPKQNGCVSLPCPVPRCENRPGPRADPTGDGSQSSLRAPAGAQWTNLTSFAVGISPISRDPRDLWDLWDLWDKKKPVGLWENRGITPFASVVCNFAFRGPSSLDVEAANFSAAAVWF